MTDYSFNPNNVYKLNTHEDSFHLHKILGLLAVCNFTYRFINFIIYGDMRFDILPHSILIHLLLPVSSLIFKISSKRHEKLAIIYPELRLHSIVFTLRSVVCYYLCYYNYNIIYRIITCLMTNVLADVVTMFYGQTSTIRGLNMPKLTEKEIKGLKISYAGNQIAATVMMMTNMNCIFYVLFPIQFAAFGMTLVKKGIIDSNLYNELYAWSLLMGFTFIVNDTKTALVVGFSRYILSILRLNYNVNKYLLWSTFFSFYYLIHNIKMENFQLFNVVFVSLFMVKRIIKIFSIFHKNEMTN